MVGSHNFGRSLAICAMVLGLALMAAPASAQTGQLKGKVTRRAEEADRGGHRH